jgi:hypothetical protein
MSSPPKQVRTAHRGPGAAASCHRGEGAGRCGRRGGAGAAGLSPPRRAPRPPPPAASGLGSLSAALAAAAVLPSQTHTITFASGITTVSVSDTQLPQPTAGASVTVDGAGTVTIVATNQGTGATLSVGPYTGNPANRGAIVFTRVTFESVRFSVGAACVRLQLSGCTLSRVPPGVPAPAPGGASAITLAGGPTAPNQPSLELSDVTISGFRRCALDNTVTSAGACPGGAISATLASGVTATRAPPRGRGVGARQAAGGRRRRHRRGSGRGRAAGAAPAAAAAAPAPRCPPRARGARPIRHPPPPPCPPAGAVFTGNQASGGGAVYASQGTQVTLTDCDVTGNAALVGGGFFGSEGRLVARGCKFSSNSAAFSPPGATAFTGYSGVGGAVAAVGSGAAADLASSVVDGNTAGDYSSSEVALGGGVFVADGAALRVDNAIVSRNTVVGNVPGCGGGVAVIDAVSTASITSATIIDNAITPSSGAMGSAVCVDLVPGFSSVTLSNTVLWGAGTLLYFIHALQLTITYSLVGTTLGGCPPTVCGAGTFGTPDPKLTLVQAPGSRPDMYYKPEAGSPVINAGGGGITSATLDILGAPRVSRGRPRTSSRCSRGEGARATPATRPPALRRPSTQPKRQLQWGPQLHPHPTPHTNLNINPHTNPTPAANPIRPPTHPHRPPLCRAPRCRAAPSTSAPSSSKTQHPSS